MDFYEIMLQQKLAGKSQSDTIPWDDILPTDTASGQIASFPDGTDLLPAKSVSVALEPIQEGSGTPSPSNIRPISGRTECVTEVCGANLFDKDTIKTSAGNWILNDNGVQVADSNSSYFLENTRVFPSTTYYRIGNTTKGGLQRLYFFDENENFISRMAIGTSDGTFTTPSNCYYLGYQYLRTNLDTSEWSINYPSTDTSYHAYNGRTYTTPLGRTVYGCTLDVVSGVLTVYRAKHTFDGTDAIGLENWRPLDNSSGWLYQPSVTQGMTDVQTSITTMSDVISDTLATQTYANLYASDTNGISIVGGTSWGIGMRVADTSLRTASAINAWLAENPVTVCYKLATPQTYQLTPQDIALLKGNNNVWSDGEVEVEYYADVQKWVEKKLG